jgi:predicted ATPase
MRILAEQLLTLAQDHKDPTLRLLAGFAMGFVLYWLGEFTSARANAEYGLAVYDPGQHRSLTFLYSQDLGGSCQVPTSFALWQLGYPDQALKGGEGALALARGWTDSFSSIQALIIVAVVHQFRREPKATQECAEEIIALCTEHGIPFFLAWGTSLRGWALAEQGQREEGLEQMRRGLTDHRAVGSRISESRWLALQAVTCAETGRLRKRWTSLPTPVTM